MKQITFILDKFGHPLTPTFNQNKVRTLLKNDKAEIVDHFPFFVIKLKKETVSMVPTLTLGIDAGYSFIGFSLIDEYQNELVGGELKLRNDIKGLLEDKKRNRSLKRHKLRYRKPRFNNRKPKNKYKTGGKVKTIAPSISHKIETHLDLIDRLYKIAPIKLINIELANFDIQKIKNSDIKNEEYQQGMQFGFWNLREAVLFRDNHKCQNPNCKGNSKILSVHHLVYRSEGGTNAPTNLITLCTDCHTPKNHKKGGFLYDWMKSEKKNTKSFKDSTFMNMLKWNIFLELKEKYECQIKMKFGYATKSNRIKYKIDKTHHKDAYVIAGGTVNTKITEPLKLVKIRRNNRSLDSFRDAKFFDIRDEVLEKKSGSELSNGRTKRNKNLNTENLRKYRKIILNKDGKRDARSKGMIIHRETRSVFPKGTIIEMLEDVKTTKGFAKKGTRHTILGSANKGTRILITKTFNVNSKKIKIIAKKNGIILDN